MDWSALAAWRYRRTAIPGAVALVAIAVIALGWPLLANFEAHRAGYISGVLKRGASCGAKISPSAENRLQQYTLANVVSFTAGFAAGTKQVEKSREAAGYPNTCRLLVGRYANAAERPFLIALPSELTEGEWPFWLLGILTVWLLWWSLRSKVGRWLPLVNWSRVLFCVWGLLSVIWVSLVGVRTLSEWPPEPAGTYAITGKWGAWENKWRPVTAEERAAHTKSVVLLLLIAAGFAAGPPIGLLGIAKALVWIRHRVRGDESAPMGLDHDHVVREPPMLPWGTDRVRQAEIIRERFLKLGGPPEEKRQ